LRFDTLNPTAFFVDHGPTGNLVHQ
jgi:hypothetical protein